MCKEALLTQNSSQLTCWGKEGDLNNNCFLDEMQLMSHTSICIALVRLLIVFWWKILEVLCKAMVFWLCVYRNLHPYLLIYSIRRTAFWCLSMGLWKYFSLCNFFTIHINWIILQMLSFIFSFRTSPRTNITLSGKKKRKLIKRLKHSQPKPVTNDDGKYCTNDCFECQLCQ